MNSFLTGPGQLGRLIGEHDWSTTPLGPIDGWPQSLKTSVNLMLNSAHPMWIGWGPRATFLYNDAYVDVLSAAKHPWALGRPAAEVWAEIWDICGPLAAQVFERGEASFFDEVRLFMSRGDFLEETFYSFSYSPIRDESGTVGGLFCPSSDVSAKVIGARRLRTLSELAAQALVQKSIGATCDAAMRTIAAAPDDVPFALLYLQPEGSDAVELAGSAGLEGDRPADSPLAQAARWPIALAMTTVQPQWVDTSRFEGLPRGIAGQRVRQAVVHPVVASGQRPIGALVAGVSPGCRLDTATSAFFGLIAGQVAAALQHARAAEEERRRAAALAELDRAKTLFFSNVSHEFRTPLTLMLAPLNDALSDEEHVLPDTQRERLLLMRRNALRLNKLVNTLLDFARIEAGRLRAVFVPTDLATLTADLASSFRATIEHAGLEFTVDCRALPANIHVDRSMWEQIVLNLLSNAFKFTLAGGIGVRLGIEDDHAVLRISDTGPGIAAPHLPRLFERFHRIEGTPARTHEGSGIGLALVKDLVDLHGGELSVQSTPGRGSTFTIRLRPGHAHLPADQVHAAPDPAESATPTLFDAYIAEAERWVQTPAVSSERDEDNPALALPDAAPRSTTRIVIADDNADLRDYLRRLLGAHWRVEAVSDGAQALAALRREPADLLLCDVMMPALDGFALLKEVRADAVLRGLPVLMLSARAGEEARIEALNAGADAYMVKPFSARELLARVETLLLRGELRKSEQRHARRMATVFAQAPVGIALLRGPDHVYELANPLYSELLGERPLIGRSVREALPETAGQSIHELLDEVYRSGRPHVGRLLRLELIDADGMRREHFFDFVYQPMFDLRGAVEGIAVVVFEVTELARARRMAEVANRAKDEFLAMLGHELRNPLAPILTALHLMRLRGGAGVEKERAVIERQARHLVQLVDDLLDVARITEGKVELRRERVELAQVVAKAVETTAPLIQERRHRLDVDVPGQGLPVDADPMRLAQVIGNLLTNAAKYTEPGGHLQVEARRERRHGDDAVRIWVRDDGIGIAPEMLPLVFERFVQEKQALDRARGGLGLGLAIVRSLTELHGGQVEAASEGVGRGSVFTLRLPLAATTQAPAAPVGDPDPAAKLDAKAPADASPAAPALAILIVDDNADAALALAEGLAIHGHRTRVAFDGTQGLEEAARLRPDIVLLDIGLPGADGYEVAGQLRRLPGLETTRLWALSGYGLPHHRERSAQAGFEHHLVKPIDFGKLLALIEQARDGLG